MIMADLSYSAECYRGIQFTREAYDFQEKFMIASKDS